MSSCRAYRLRSNGRNGSPSRNPTCKSGRWPWSARSLRVTSFGWEPSSQAHTQLPGAAIAYFAFQATAHAIWGAALPPAPVPGSLEWALIVLAVGSFGLVAFAQALFPLWAHHPSTAGLRVHLANGFYLNALLDRAIGGFRTTKAN